MEAVLYDASRTTTVCQNENNLNSCCGPVRRKMLHDGLSSNDLNIIDACAWNKNKMMTRPKIIPINTNFLTLTGKTCLSREILETEKIFFGTKEDMNFS